jgi:hypothetical protein
MSINHSAMPIVKNIQNRTIILAVRAIALAMAMAVAVINIGE